MTNTGKPLHLTVQFNTGEKIAEEELDQNTRHLLQTVRELDVESADLKKGGDVPAGAKSGEIITVGTLAVVVLPAVVPKLIEIFQEWSARSKNRTVKIKAQVENRSIEVEYSPTSMTMEELKRLVNTLTDAMPPSAPG